jgi:hypothetical protein
LCGMTMEKEEIQRHYHKEDPKPYGEASKAKNAGKKWLLQHAKVSKRRT